MKKMKADIIRAIAAIDSLPSFPDVLVRFQNEMASETPDIKKLAAIIEDDPALTAKFLKAVNSAFYARTTRIASVSQSISRLGIMETRRLAITTALMDRYKAFGGIVPESFWRHSIAVAFTSRAILQIGQHSLSPEAVESAYVACLLHDIGVVVLFHLFEDSYRDEYSAQLEKGGISIEDEEARFGIHHGEAGAALIRSWQLPEILHDPVLYHHMPSWADEAAKPLAYLVHLSDFVCNNIGVARMETRIETEFDEAAFDMFHLSLTQVPEIIAHVKAEATAADSIVQIR
ncbi:MAG: HDOD domain-containing protein [Deltaproteobacteria bacterium]|nr:HDOD domain-containing protein [Deltaproteobacteria bacterium]